MKIQAASVNVTLIAVYLDVDGNEIYQAEPEVRVLKPGQKLMYSVPDPIEIALQVV